MKRSASRQQNPSRQSRPGGTATSRPPAVAARKAAKPSAAPKRQPAGLLEEHFPDSEAHMVTFEYFNPSARQVLVAGSFNGWDPHATEMTRQRGGKWSSRLLLKPGHYEYRFVVDGHWQDDPLAARFIANPFGGLNCVVEVQAMPLASPRRS